MLSYDSYWTVATAISLVRHGTTQVDEFVDAAPAVAYGLECPPGTGHCYNLYPLGTAVLAAPIVAADPSGGPDDRTSCSAQRRDLC